MYMYLFVDIIIEIIHYVLNTLITNKAASILIEFIQGEEVTSGLYKDYVISIIYRT